MVESAAKSHGWSVPPKADRELRQARTALLAKRAPGTASHRVKWSGGETEVLTLGRGPPLVLVHGGLGEAGNWAQVMPLLAARFRVLAIDRPGHGLADPFDYTGVDVLGHAVTFFDEVFDALDLDVVPLVANSMGGAWGIEYALRRPDRVSRLILAGVPAGSRRELSPEIFEVFKLLRMMNRPIIGAILQSAMRKPSGRERGRQGFAPMVAHPERLDDEFLDSQTFNFLRNSRSMRTLVERAVDGEGMRLPFILDNRWRDLSVPTTLLWGDRDIFDTIDHGKQIAMQVPDGHLIAIRDSGHLPWLDSPDRFAAGVSAALTGLADVSPVPV